MENNQKVDVLNETPPEIPTQTKFCKYCGAKIPMQAVICTACGCQVEELKTTPVQPQTTPNVVINNANTNTNVNTNAAMAFPYRKAKNKWVALLLCLFLGGLGAHKFYEGKVGMGVLYLFTVGLCGIGVFVDLIVLLTKPNPYYV